MSKSVIQRGSDDGELSERGETRMSGDYVIGSITVVLLKNLCLD